MDNKKTPKDIYYDLCDKYIETMDRGDIVEMAMIEYAEQQVKLFAIPDVRLSLPDEDVSEPIQNALYATNAFTTDQCSNITDGILLYLKDAGFEIVKGQ